MLLFGVNFSCYYLLLVRQWKSVFADEELRLYIGIVFVAIALIVLNLRGYYGTMGETVRHAAFQVGSIITTTGFATTDFDLWPSFSKTILLCLMVVGACAGSTGGGLKVARLLLLLKGLRRNTRQMLSPRKIEAVRNNGQVVSERILENTNAYLAAYVVILFGVFAVISLDGFSVGTNFSATLACFNNIGPGLEAVGPTCNFSAYSPLSKLVLSFAMLAGRLEIFPILVLFSKDTWFHR
jgi:trk system potassium uptake protein TrkH